MTPRRPAVPRFVPTLAVLALGGCVAVAPAVRPDPGGGEGGGRASARLPGGQVLVAASPRSGGPSAAGPGTGASADPGAPASPDAPAGTSPAPGAGPSSGFAPAASADPAGGLVGALPSAAPPVFQSPVAVTPGASPRPNPFGLPTTVSLALPSGLAALVQAHLVSNNGGSLVTDNGAGIISDHGGGLLGKMKLRLAQAPAASPSPSLSSAGAKLVGDTLGNLTLPQDVVNGMLQGAAAAGLQADQAVVFQAGTPPMPHVMKLAVGADHATLTIDQGEVPDPAKRIAALAYTSPTKGKVVFDMLPPVAGGPRIRVYEDFDLGAGTIVAAAAASVPGPIPGKPLLQTSRYDLRRLDGAPDGRAFALRTTTAQYNPYNPITPMGWKIAADFAADGTGAYWAELFNTLGGPFLVPTDGVSINKTPPAPYAFYIGVDGKDVLEADAPAALRALLPKLDVVTPAYPPSAKDVDPFMDPLFVFPE